MSSGLARPVGEVLRLSTLIMIENIRRPRTRLSSVKSFQRTTQAIRNPVGRKSSIA